MTEYNSYKSKRNPMRTRFRGEYINNDDLQKFLAKESLSAMKLGFYETSDFLSELVDKLEGLKD
jgi:hypothetical protein